MSGRTGRHVGVYRRLALLYPSTFRREYGDDLRALFADQLRDEPAWRVWARTIRDLSVSVPLQHVEARVQRPSPYLVSATFAVVAGVAGAAAVLIGTGPAFVPVALVALLSGAIATWSWRGRRPVYPRSGLWWRLLLAGPLLAVTTFAAMSIELPDLVDIGENTYWVKVAAFLTSIMLAVAGVLLGVIRLLARRRLRPAI